MSELSKFSVHVACGFGVVLLFQHCDILCTLILWMLLCYHMMGQVLLWGEV